MKYFCALFSRRANLKNSKTSFTFGFAPALIAAMWLQQAPLLTWLLLAMIAGIILIFVLIAFILRPLSRRTRPPASAPPQPPKDEFDLPPDSGKIDTAINSPIPDALLEASLPPDVLAAGKPVTMPINGERPAGIAWHIAGLTDVGLRRELNEDNLLLLEGTIAEMGPFGLYVVADGLGGHEAGEIASQITVDTIRQQLADAPPTAADRPFENWFKTIILDANDAVLNYQDSHKEAQKMGSTLVMALLVDQHAYITNVGDSRAYRLTANTVEQISTDHSLVERLVQIGQITRDEARTHKQRNVVYSIIGEKRRLEVGYYQTTLKPGDRLLLCSDGLSGLVTDEEMLAISQNEPDLGRTSQKLIEAAKRAGGHDNITAILVQMDGP